MVSNSVSEGGRPNHRCATRSATLTNPSAETSETFPLPMTKRLTEYSAVLVRTPASSGVDPQAGVEEAGDRAREHPGHHGDTGRDQGRGAAYQQRGDHRGTEAERAVRGEVEGPVDPVGDEDAQAEERQDEADGERADEEIHRPAQPTSVIGPTQATPRSSALSATPASPRSSHNR